ncbi:hypothetical protein GCM10027280_50970 [Micromonospora polyrhachis]|uniref:Uncharacterized protein n=1 Tax=Micromonospora polyrhachis TaxID=1282883 RepID=A0A7W7SV72_9ACTN|nr:DUF6401 family natural product biosynthesis protein [Micromonospora polyrhachis]MBB4961521.1 hypothetical protein [Micromonospora polyrhachis]
MNRPFSGEAARRTADKSARAALTDLMASVGTPGLSAAARRPGLQATLDQHAASIRDSLDGDRRPIGAVRLAGYAEGVREAAADNGWHLPVEPIEWADADWMLLRLLAVCDLAQRSGAVARVGRH